MDSSEVIRLLLVDDEELVRAGLRLLLDGTDGIAVVGEADNGREAVRQVARLAPDVVLMDIRMPVLDGVAALDQLPEPGPAVLMLTAFDTREDIMTALRGGARGFLRKATKPASLIAAIHAAAVGQSALNPEVVGALVQEIGSGEQRERVRALSQRESEIAALITEGLTNEAIAAEVHLAVPTIKTYVSRIMEKLDAANRVQIAVAVLRGS